MTQKAKIPCCMPQCKKVALRVVGSKGYCEDHTREAFEHAKRLISGSQRGGILSSN